MARNKIAYEKNNYNLLNIQHIPNILQKLSLIFPTTIQINICKLHFADKKTGLLVFSGYTANNCWT